MARVPVTSAAGTLARSRAGSPEGLMCRARRRAQKERAAGDAGAAAAPDDKEGAAAPGAAQAGGAGGKRAASGEEAAGTPETGLGVAGMLRRIGLWAIEVPGRGEIRIAADEVARWLRAEARCAAPARRLAPLGERAGRVRLMAGDTVAGCAPCSCTLRALVQVEAGSLRAVSVV